MDRTGFLFFYTLLFLFDFNNLMTLNEAVQLVSFTRIKFTTAFVFHIVL